MVERYTLLDNCPPMHETRLMKKQRVLATIVFSVVEIAVQVFLVADQTVQG